MSRLLQIGCAVFAIGVTVALRTGDHAFCQTPRPLTVVAIGDVGEGGKVLRHNAETLLEMANGMNDAGVFDVLLFLGDNFYETGLNLPEEDVEGKVKEVLGPFREIFDFVPPDRVHAISGNHDYYRTLALKTSLLFGLVSLAELPIGMSDKGNRRAAEIEFWTYHSGYPSSVAYPISEGSAVSAEFIFVDSPVFLRTDPARWRGALDSLSRLLRRSALRRGVIWRSLVMHHPIRSVGVHGGYSIWDDETRTVEYLTNCDRDSNAVGWLKNWLDPEDCCADRYRWYIDSLQAAVDRGGATIQIALSGHDHSLQLLPLREQHDGLNVRPGVQVVSGAGARPSRVRLPLPPREFTSSNAAGEGISFPGFVQMKFARERVRLIFFNGSEARPLDMGGGALEFWIDRKGNLVEAAKQQ